MINPETVNEEFNHLNQTGFLINNKIFYLSFFNLEGRNLHQQPSSPKPVDCKRSYRKI